MGGWSRTEFFWGVPDGSRAVAPPRLRPTRDPPKDGKISRGGSAPPDPPGLRLRAEMPMADDHGLSWNTARSNGHNSARIRPFSTKLVLSCTKFRGATRGTTPEAEARPKTGFEPEIKISAPKIMVSENVTEHPRRKFPQKGWRKHKIEV